MTFESLGLDRPILNTLAQEGYEQPTPIQAQAIPQILKGRDVVGIAQTGTGKTAAFTLPLLHHLVANKIPTKANSVRVLVLSPTRELASQIEKAVRTYGSKLPLKSATVMGGVSMRPQRQKLAQGVDILVATPGRLLDLIDQKALDLRRVETLVLDEADQMLDMGFINDVKKIEKLCQKKKQTLLFSATFPDQIQEIVKKITHDPVIAKVEASHDQSLIAQHFYSVPFKERIDAMHIFLQNQQPESCVIFCNMKKDTQEVTDQLLALGFNALCLNGDLEQREREQMLVCFTNKSANILVATDVAARGLDIEALDLVINYQLSHDPEVHVHRVGRTGRAGSKGIAVSFFDEKDGNKLVALEVVAVATSSSVISLIIVV